MNTHTTRAAVRDLCPHPSDRLVVRNGLVFPPLRLGDMPILP
ncbi:MAG: hypothetical protein ACK443_07440 [Methylococcaceae bacterium]